MSLKAKVEAIIYAAEDPVTLEQMSLLLKDVVLADLASTKENLAIEQADSAAEAAAESAAESAIEFAQPEALVSEEAKSAEATETELLPELALDSAELICPEPGPLMPEEASLVGTAGRESTEVNSASEASSAANPDPKQAAPKDTQTKDLSEGRADETCEEATAQDVARPSSEPDTELAPAPLDSGLESASKEETPSSQQTASADPTPSDSATVAAPETTSRKRQPKKTEKEIAEEKAVRARVREVLIELVTDYANEDRGMEIRQVAGGFRMATKPEHHDVVRAFAKSLKPPIRLSLAALETLAVIAYKQPVTGPEIADIRGVESASVLGTLLDRKLITTAGRKQVIGRPMQYKTSKDFLVRFGLNDVNELPSMEEFSQLASDGTIEITPAEPQENLSLFEPEVSALEVSSTEDAADNVPSNVVPTDEDSGPDVVNNAAHESAVNPAHTEDAALPIAEPLELESAAPENRETLHPEPSLPESQATAQQSQPSHAAEAADSQPQSDAESSNVPETEHPVGK